jgi:hypothetical protein
MRLVLALALAYATAASPHGTPKRPSPPSFVPLMRLNCSAVSPLFGSAVNSVLMSVCGRGCEMDAREMSEGEVRLFADREVEDFLRPREKSVEVEVEARCRVGMGDGAVVERVRVCVRESRVGFCVGEVVGSGMGGGAAGAERNMEKMPERRCGTATSGSGGAIEMPGGYCSSSRTSKYAGASPRGSEPSSGVSWGEWGMGE